MFFNDYYPLDIKTDIKEPHNYMKCNKVTQLTEYHRDTSKWDYYLLQNGNTTYFTNKNDIIPQNIYYCVNTLIICTNKQNIGKAITTDKIGTIIYNKQQSDTVINLYKYMKEKYPYFDDENVDTWDKEFKTGENKPSTINGMFPIIDKIVEPLYKSKEYNFIIFNSCNAFIETKYTTNNHIFGILLYLKLYGYIILSAMHIKFQNSLKEKLIQKLDGNTYLKVIQEYPNVAGEPEEGHNLFTVLQKIRELNEDDKESAKKFCNWKS